MKTDRILKYWPYIAMALLFLAAVLFRPLLPIDETRYMTVAWEMWLNKGWLSPLTLNFEPYHHKPPLLFWLINLSWSIFGVSRWAGLIPVCVSSLLVVFLTVKLAQKILPPEKFNAQRLAFLITGSVPFLIYSTLIMFDLTLTVFVLAAFLCLFPYKEERRLRDMMLLGLFMGLGVLTKGPVAYLYVLFPVLLAPWWVSGFTRGGAWYKDVLLAVLVSLVPVGLWVFPVLVQADNHFAFWLLWEQTAGRVAGNFEDAHNRPFYFYLPLLPILFLPWLFFPSFWRFFKGLKEDSGTRFLFCWTVPVFLCFCLISGKQPHYLLPLLPGVIIFIYRALENANMTAVRNVSGAMVLLVFAGQGIVAQGPFKNYDLKPIAAYVEANSAKDFAFVRNYHGEIGFLGKVRKPIADRQFDDLDAWLEGHPHGEAIIRYKRPEEVQKYREVFSIPYRGKRIGIFTSENSNN
jgi:4-amino-4-deoxy-L-arabinose transferase-like glycosyltransferase